MDYLNEAIKSLRPEAQFAYYGDDYETIIWHNLDGDAPTKESIDVEIERIKAEEVNQAALRAEQKAGLLARLGITAEEAELLLS